MRGVSRPKVLLTLAGLVGGLLMGAVLTFSLSLHTARGEQVLFTGSSLAHAASGAALSLADVAERSLPSVVNVSTTRTSHANVSPFMMDPMLREFFRHFGRPDPSPRREQSLGSGVIIAADGVVVTNNHVVKDADQIKVTVGGKQDYEATVVGTDPKSDLAVLRLKGARGLKAIHIGNSDKLRLGDMVLAIGNPFGVGQTVTMGIVSAKGRANMGIVDYEDFIQTDAAINPGNSGGALINMSGELVGINTAILSRTGGSQGIGFAIPTNMVNPIVQSLVKRGRVIRGWLGVGIQDVNRELARALKLPTTRGVLVASVEPGSPAQKSGLRRGDLVVRLDGKAVPTSGQLRNMVASAGAKTHVKLEYYREGRLQTIQLTLAELPTRLGMASGQHGQPGQPDVAGGLGVSVESVRSPQARRQYNIPSRLKYGVVVMGVDPRGVAARNGIRSGDVILEVNRATITSVRRFTQMLQAARGDILFLVYRQGATQYMIIDR